MGVASSALGDNVMSNLAIHAAPCSVVLPPGQAVSQVPRNEEADFSRGQPMVSHGSIVGQFSHDGLCRTSWIRQNKAQHFVFQPLKACLLLTS